MRRPFLCALLLSLAGLHTLMVASAEDAKPVAPSGWIYVGDSTHKLASRPGHWTDKAPALTRGTLAPVLKVQEKGGTKWAQVHILDLATASPLVGWVEVDQAEISPADAYPKDSALLGQIGGSSADDFFAQHTEIARFLVRQGAGSPILLCYVFCSRLPTAKLIAFTRQRERFRLSGFLDFPIDELHAGVVFLEVRDLLANENECFVTHEPFYQGLEIRGTNLVIRRFESDEIQILWQAPLEFRHLSEFRSKIQILEPSEENIGAPGTVTTGDVKFRTRGNVQEPVWKGKVEFFLFGREEAADSVTLEKVCPWDGRKFAPLW